MGNAYQVGYNDDSRSRLTGVKLPSGRMQRVSYETTATGNTETTVTDAKGNKRTGLASASGTELSTSDKGNGSVAPITTSYEYDAEGRQTKSKNTEGNYRLSVYDAKGQTLQTKTFDKTGELTLTSKYSYDISGNMTEEKDYEVKEGAETLLRGKTYEYTGLDKLSKVTETDGSRTSTISYSYDMEDDLTGVTYSGNASKVDGLEYVYNDYKWLTEIRAVISGNTKTLREYSYTNDGKVATIKDHRDMGSASGNDFTQIDFSYDDLDRPVKMEYRENGTGEVRESYAVKYDKNGSIISEDAVNGYPSSEDSGKLDRLKEYTYDADGQLTATEIKDDIDNTVKDISYTYDAAGNRAKETESGSGTDDGRVTTDYTYNSLDQMTGAKTMQAEDTVSDKTYTYDGNGNQIKEADSENKITNIMTYDGENRLSTVTKKEIKSVEASEDSEDTDGDGITVNTEEEVTTKVQSNKYNGDGQRISKTEGNNRTKYFYQDGAVLCTTDGNNGMTSFNMLGTEGNIIASARNENGSEKYYYYNKDIRNSTTN
ncbi:MAG: hypothetical protein VB031_08770, partial [Eubacteriaceae bacterium]|nr:hypothetical protein [Eubacteriaceae bacterium]